MPLLSIKKEYLYMREPLRDQLRLLHIIDACDRIKSYFPNEKIPLLDSKSIEFFGLVKNLEIIGEAAYMLTPDFKLTHSATEWNDIIRMRHLLVYGYYHISPEIVKEITEIEIPLLRQQITSYLSEHKQN